MNNTGQEQQSTNSTKTVTSARRAVAVACIVYLVVVIPQANKAFHIDDTMFLMQAEHLCRDPLGPYGFEINWENETESSLLNNFNPPLVGYFLAVVSRIVGMNEIGLHLCMGLFVWLSAYWTYRLCAEFTVRPLLAAALVLSSPVFAATTNCMADVPQFALGVGGVFLFWRASASQGALRAKARSAMFLLGLAIWTKYAAAFFTGLVVVLAWFRSRRAIAFVWIPIVMLGVLVGLQLATHGRTHFFASQATKRYPVFFSMPLIVLLQLGASSAASAILLCFACRGRRWISCSAAAAATLAAYSWMHYQIGRTDEYAINIAKAAALAGPEILILTALGGACVAAAAATLLSSTDFSERWLAFWVVAGVAFAAVHPVFPAARRLLAILPPIAILAVRQLERASGPTLTCSWAVTLAQSALAALVAAADAEQASVYRTYVRDHAQHYRDRNVWTLGHHGWQWYATKAGWQPFDLRRSRPERSDLLVVPLLVHKQNLYLEAGSNGTYGLVGFLRDERRPRRNGALRLIRTDEMPGFWPLRTVYEPGEVQLYGAILPMALVRGRPLEVFELYEFVSVP